MDDTNPAWSPDGNKIAFVSYKEGERDIYVMNADGTGRTRLTFSERVSAVAWSPDGIKIAYSAEWEGNSEIYIMNAAGSGPHVNITNHPASDNSPSWAR